MDLSFTRFGKNLFDGMTQAWHAALLSARPSQRTRTRLRGLAQFNMIGRIRTVQAQMNGFD